MNLGQQIAQYLLSGLSTGAIYSLIGVGFAIIHNATGIINFAQGELVMLGGMFTLFFLTALNLPLLVAIILAIGATTLVGVVFERLAIRPMKNASPISLVIITIGGSILIRGIAMIVWGKDTHAIPTFSGNEPIHLGEATILPQHLWIFAVTIVVMICSKLYFNYTISGKAMRACAYNRRAAGLVGIDVRRMVLFSFAISSAMGSLAGIIIAPLTMTSYDVGIMLGLKGFCAAIIGGMSSGLGTILGGILLGILESLGAGLFSSGYKDAIAFIILLLILFVRPQGLFRKGETERV
ncbi:branched-chain amino acid ABC transporter permease [Geobacter sulfurreducens]|uniref:Branched-chain amino acid ABC transporter, membrane protein n=1 Tax=Geobacter sulfurreducens (strain ATCC 51573 / DSM 12127 / PCA) TaxID=243231 RepID=Q74CE1_GEOSL|nr:branched-chain amino acid ABC transporter permease [Geobacter sulfurreducens]AAR35110.1 branched-chain amino acid ABC transporter, membrane protein [Geobacter sulfurreducens PCA]ADI84570.1 branched-chain amino acid ABC transporter, membrane protein [Geobacter sulfurreducens KN400]AJY71259.1 ABC transporter permease [Geobacter sulfurreducens]QVW33689.1 branched-chain amino acid ABC transporter permease [Geobacter sulfurreducens]UAC05728.1 branched-chain amino acid ABC transporter permease [G